VLVWITRSEPGASRQAREIEAAGHRCVVAPVLRIEALAGDPPAGPYDLLIFVSEHAVHHGLPRVDPGAARLLAVGARTAAALAERGRAARQPPRADSEGLLALPELSAVAGRRVLVVCGAGGRTLLVEELAARGARVDRFVCYRRQPVEAVPGEVADIGAIVAGSADGLGVIARIWPAAGGAADVPLLVPSARVQAHAVALGFRNVHDCGGADTAAVLQGLAELERTGAA
jgi:uroporphyrinogen-III synthase